MRMRGRIADAAAELFAARGYDDVVVIDVARAADVSEQTVYNYFPAKQDLVLDRAEEIRLAFAAAVVERSADVTPAAAVRPLVMAVIDLMRTEHLAAARGQFAAQCVVSPPLRRFALEFREQQARSIADAIRTTDPDVPAMVALAHASALVSVVQAVTDGVGSQVIAAATGGDEDRAADHLHRDADLALDHLDRSFRTVTSHRGSR